MYTIQFCRQQVVGCAHKSSMIFFFLCHDKLLIELHELNHYLKHPKRKFIELKWFVPYTSTFLVGNHNGWWKIPAFFGSTNQSLCPVPPLWRRKLLPMHLRHIDSHCKCYTWDLMFVHQVFTGDGWSISIDLNANDSVFLHEYERGRHFMVPLWKMAHIERLFFMGVISSCLSLFFPGFLNHCQLHTIHQKKNRKKEGSHFKMVLTLENKLLLLFFY